MKFVTNFGSNRVIIYPNDKTEKPSHERSRYIYIYIYILNIYSKVNIQLVLIYTLTLMYILFI